MNIFGINSGNTVAKIEPDTSVNSDSKRTDNKLVNTNLTVPDGSDQRIESRVATVRQQVPSTTNTADTNRSSSRKPQVSSDLSYALTSIGIQNNTSSNPDDSQNQDSNKQSRSDSSQPIDPEKEAIQKKPIQF
ncbi:MAG: hypothetical protein JWQ35_171 [Bacteriovoracaceae bacterium]|nr:hypothetical protein [Bacteriovoracaceae bacterium]